MADIGLKYMAGAIMDTDPENAQPTYEPGFVIGKMVSTNLTVTNAEGELYADDQLSEYVSEFSSADFTAEVDNIPLEKQAIMYGATYEDNELFHSTNDTPPYMAIGGAQQFRINGARSIAPGILRKLRLPCPTGRVPPRAAQSPLERSRSR